MNSSSRYKRYIYSFSYKMKSKYVCWNVLMIPNNMNCFMIWRSIVPFQPSTYINGGVSHTLGRIFVQNIKLAHSPSLNTLFKSEDVLDPQMNACHDTCVSKSELPHYQFYCPEFISTSIVNGVLDKKWADSVVSQV